MFLEEIGHYEKQLRDKRKSMYFSRFSIFSDLLFSSLRHGLIGMVVNFSIGAIYASHGNIDYHLSPNAKRVTQ